MIFVGMNNEEKIICIKKDELETGYYINDSVYYKSMDFYEKCENDISCDKCTDNYKNLNNSFLRIIKNCELYNNNRECQKYNENYTLNGEKRDECIKKEEFNEFYFTKDNGDSYYLYNGEGENHIQNGINALII